MPMPNQTRQNNLDPSPREKEIKVTLGHKRTQKATLGLKRPQKATKGHRRPQKATKARRALKATIMWYKN